MDKKRLFVFVSILFCVLSFVAVILVLYASSPLHPQNITDKTVFQKGAEYTVRLTGVSDYDENGFVLVADGFYFTGEKVFVYKDEKGIARTTYDGKGECCLLGEYNSSFIDYEKYNFCGESYKNKAELEAFFDEPECIYDFDINKLGDYVQDIINYKRHFYGNATVKIYRGRLVVTDIYIGDEKVLEYKR